MHIETTAIHGGKKDDSGKASVNYPIYLSSTFVQPDSETFQEFAYSRGANPTRQYVEELAADLEGASYALATASGMAATSLVFELLHSGDKVLINDNVYGGTWRFVSNLFKNRGIEYEVVRDLNRFDFETVSENTRMVFIETPSNPLLGVTDIQEVSRRAHEKGLLVVVDNTFMTAYLQKPLELGADIVEYSATKYYGGHSDLLAGLVLTNSKELYEELKFLSNTLGGILSPLDSFLLARGIKTLPVRMDRHMENAQKIAEFLRSHDGALQVFYPGMQSDRGYEIQKKQARGAGGVVSFLFNTEDYDLRAFVDALDLFAFAVSLGGVESLICRPATMTHESYSPELQKAIGIQDNLLRISAGLEHSQDLIDELDRAFEKSRKGNIV